MVRSKIVTDHGKRYYVDKNGWRRAGRIRIGRNWYAFDRKTGVQLRNAWFTDTDGSRYYAGNRYSLVQGFYRPDSYYRYFRPSDGKMLTGWQTIDGYRYLFNNRTGVRYDLQKVTLQRTCTVLTDREECTEITGQLLAEKTIMLRITGFLQPAGLTWMETVII